MKIKGDDKPLLLEDIVTRSFALQTGVWHPLWMVFLLMAMGRAATMINGAGPSPIAVLVIGGLCLSGGIVAAVATAPRGFGKLQELGSSQKGPKRGGEQGSQEKVGSIWVRMGAVLVPVLLVLIFALPDLLSAFLLAFMVGSSPMGFWCQAVILRGGEQDIKTAEKFFRVCLVDLAVTGCLISLASLAPEENAVFTPRVIAGWLVVLRACFGSQFALAFEAIGDVLESLREGGDPPNISSLFGRVIKKYQSQDGHVQDLHVAVRRRLVSSYGVTLYFLALLIGYYPSDGASKEVVSGMAVASMWSWAIWLVPVGWLILEGFGSLSQRRVLRDLHARRELSEFFGRGIEHIDHLGGTEDEIRESDGFFVVAHPHYRHFKVGRVGDGGYVTWITGGAKGLLPDEGEAIVIRSTTLIDGGVSETGDAFGSSLARTCVELAPPLIMQELEEVEQMLIAPWGATVCSGREVTAFMKMPWDHPELLVIPTSWSEQLCFPAGCGIHDKDGYPCQARSVRVRIGVKGEVVRTVRGGEPEDRGSSWHRFCTSLTVNARRVLPAVYEATLSSLVDLFRTESVDVFMENSDKDNKSVHSFVQKLNERVAGRLPRELQELFVVEIEDLDVDTYFMERPQEQLFNLRSEERRLRDDELRQLRNVRSGLRKGLLVGSADAKGMGVVSQQLTSVEKELRDSVENATRDFNAALKDLDDPTVSPAVSEALVRFEEERKGFVLSIEKSMDELRKAERDLHSASADGE